MGWLERIERAVRTEVATTRARPLIGRVAGPPAPAEQRFGLSQLMEMFSYQGIGYGVYGGDNDNRERDTTSFTRYVNGFYRDNGVIFAVILARMLLFTEAKFQWQRLINGRPGDLFGTGALSLLETPWPNGTTGDLLARMEQDVSLHGNFYATREGDRLRRLRPDWVEIVLDAAPGEAVATNIVGYLYKPGGTDSSTRPKMYLPEEVGHWAPIPDPLAQYRGMSWLSPVIREMTADQAATDHKLKFFENAATPNLAVSFSENITKDQFNAFMAAMNAAHQGTKNAYKTLYLGGGADVKTIGANMEQMDFKNTQGAGETRICAAGGVPPIIVGLSEGLQSATYSNYGMARRKFGDHWARPQWRSACAALAPLLDVPSGARLWYDDRDIAFLREDQKDVASIQTQQASTMKQLIDSGYEPDSVTAAMLNEDWSLLKHTGLFSVQLQPPGTVQKAGAVAAGAGPVAGLPAGGAGPADTTPAKTAVTGDAPTPAAADSNATPAQPQANAARTELDELREQVASLTGLVAELAERGRWDEHEHPRGPDGKFMGLEGNPADSLGSVISKGDRVQFENGVAGVVHGSAVRPNGDVKLHVQWDGNEHLSTMVDPKMVKVVDGKPEPAAPAKLATSPGAGRAEARVQALTNRKSAPRNPDLPEPYRDDYHNARIDKGMWWDEADREGVRNTAVAAAGGQVRFRTSPANMQAILDDGRAKSLAEVGRTNAPTDLELDDYLELRRATERSMMGVDESVPVSEHPIYGYLGDPDVAKVYGKVVVNLTPETRKRTTATVGDSMEGAPQPYPVDSFSKLSDEQLLASISPYEIAAGAGVQDGHISTYMEAQIHGGVGLGDIASVELPESMRGGDLEHALRQKGVPVQWRP